MHHETNGNGSCTIIVEWTEAAAKKTYFVALGEARESDVFDGIQDLSNTYGQYAVFRSMGDGVFEAIRDPLGIAKLFYVETASGELVFSGRFDQLMHHGKPVYAVPPGKHVRIAANGVRECIRACSPDIAGPICGLTRSALEHEGCERQLFRSVIQSRLETVFNAFREMEEDGWSFFVALSGGLDSSIIASYAAKHLKAPIACTLDLGNSEDSDKSIKIAQHLGLRHRVFPTNKTEILEMLDRAPSACQDFRDFNVHCAVLNLLLAKNIRSMADNTADLGGQKLAVLTGDLMNEFTCDYASEIIDGVEYYKLPRIGKKDLQRFLISGLDTSDRELTPFRMHGIECIQPYAVLHDLYAAIDESVLAGEDPKKLLNSFMVDSHIIDVIPKIKLRAQVGDRESMGILGLCHQLGITNRDFKESIMKKVDHPEVKIPIFMGKYDMEVFS